MMTQPYPPFGSSSCSASCFSFSATCTLGDLVTSVPSAVPSIVSVPSRSLPTSSATRRLFACSTSSVVAASMACAISTMLGATLGATLGAADARVDDRVSVLCDFSWVMALAARVRVLVVGRR